MVMELTFPRSLRLPKQPSALDVHRLPTTMTRMTARPGKQVSSAITPMRKKPLTIQASSQVKRSDFFADTLHGKLYLICLSAAGTSREAAEMIRLQCSALGGQPTEGLS